MTELSFLIDLLLNHDLKAETKKAIAGRIKDVEELLVNRPMAPQIPFIQQPLPPPKSNQAPSTLALMAKHGDIPASFAQTPEAAKAIASRNEAINAAISGKTEKGRTSPRKF